MRGFEGLEKETYRNHVCAVGGHVDQITTGAVRELDGVDVTSRSDNIGDVGHGGTGSRTQVEDLSTWLDVDIVETTQNTGSKLKSR